MVTEYGQNQVGAAALSTIRVGQFLKHYPHPGGTTSAVVGLSHSLTEHGIDTAILSHRSNGYDVEVLNSGARWSSASGRSARNLGHLLAGLASNAWDLDLIVLNGSFDPKLRLLTAAAQRGGTRVVLAPHNLYHPAAIGHRFGHKYLYWRTVERSTLRHVDCLQLLSTASATHIRNQGVATPTFTTASGVSGLPQLDSSVGAQPSDNLLSIVYVGRIDMWTKGLDLLLYAVADSAIRQQSVRVDLWGPHSSDSSRLAAMIRHLGLEDSVHLMGPTDKPTTTFQAYDLALYPSRYDAFPLAGVEAMASGIPVLCSTATGGLAEAVRIAGCGSVVPPNATAIATEISRLAANRSLLPQLGALARSFVNRNLLWDTIARDVAQHYRRIVDGNIH